MFAVSGAGDLLPPYVCYKSENLYNTWMENGPVGARYNRTQSGWFTSEIFCDWVMTIAFPYFRRLDGPKILIGDNLCSHISFAIIKKGLDEGINFIFLPPNSTHLCQPLDVSVFKALKSSWSTVISEWKQKNKGVIPKCFFPKLLNNSILKTVNLKENILSGFRKCGIFPFNPNSVLDCIPDKEDEMEIGKRYLDPVIKLLHATRLVTVTYSSNCSA